MDPVTLILAALVAGAGKGIGDVAASAVKDAYTGLRNKLANRLEGKPAAQTTLDEYLADPDEFGELLAKYLQKAGAHNDQEIITDAEVVMGEIDPQGARNGKYSVDLRGAQGIQVGDGNTQTNTWN